VSLVNVLQMLAADALGVKLQTVKVVHACTYASPSSSDGKDLSMHCLAHKMYCSQLQHQLQLLLTMVSAALPYLMCIIFRRHKFCVAMENSISVDYITEKVWDALSAGEDTLPAQTVAIGEYCKNLGNACHSASTAVLPD
jgi:hypothetical protein